MFMEDKTSYFLERIAKLEADNKMLRAKIIKFSDVAIDNLNCKTCLRKRGKAANEAIALLMKMDDKE